MTATAVLELDPAGYRPHRLHHPDSAWVEKNCYIDVWIEVLHALAMEPAAMLGFTLAVDFEADQWTFFKPPHQELSRLYGIEVFELNLWRGDVLSHAMRQIGEGRLVFTEVDAYWLPDARGTDYRSRHVKSTIVINTIDAQRQRLGYFHNAGYHWLEGEDFVHLFRLEAPPDPAFLPLFAEFARLDRMQRLRQPQMAPIAVELLRLHLQRAPRDNPMPRFAASFAEDLAWLKSEGLSLYHGYAFASLRQLGAAFELAARHLDWLAAQGEAGLEPAQAAFAEISAGAKAVLLKTARAVTTGKAADFQPVLEQMTSAWDAGMRHLKVRYQ